MSDDKIIGSAYVLGTQMDPTYDPPSMSLNAPAQRPTGQTVDLDEVRNSAKDPLLLALHQLDVRITGLRPDEPDLCHCGLVTEVALDALAPTFAALLADLDAARTALAEAEERLAQTERNAMTGWQLYRSEQSDHNALKAVADKLTGLLLDIGEIVSPTGEWPWEAIDQLPEAVKTIDARADVGMLTEQLADKHAALMGALDTIQEVRDLVGGYRPQTEDATKLRDLVWETVSAAGSTE